VAKRLVKLTFGAAVVGGGVWAARWALIRWIEGPPQEPTTDPWPPVVAATPAPGSASGAAPAPAPDTDTAQGADGPEADAPA
jgi:hypothetical protein